MGEILKYHYWRRIWYSPSYPLNQYFLFWEIIQDKNTHYYEKHYHHNTTCYRQKEGTQCPQ